MIPSNFEHILKNHIRPFEKAIANYQERFIKNKGPYYSGSQLARVLPFIFDDLVEVLSVFETGVFEDELDDEEQGEIKVYFKLVLNGEPFLFQM